MGLQLRRKLYTRGSSFETTVPSPLLFSIDPGKKHDVVFSYDEKSRKWYLEVIPRHPRRARAARGAKGARNWKNAGGRR